MDKPQTTETEFLKNEFKNQIDKLNDIAYECINSEDDVIKSLGSVLNVVIGSAHNQNLYYNLNMILKSFAEQAVQRMNDIQTGQASNPDVGTEPNPSSNNV